MSKKPVETFAKSKPLQVRLDPLVLARVKEIAGPNGVSDWVRDAISSSLQKLDNSLFQPEIAPAKPVVQVPEVAELLLAVKALTDVAMQTNAVVTAQSRSAANAKVELERVKAELEVLSVQYSILKELSFTSAKALGIAIPFELARSADVAQKAAASFKSKTH